MGNNFRSCYKTVSRILMKQIEARCYWTSQVNCTTQVPLKLLVQNLAGYVVMKDSFAYGNYSTSSNPGQKNCLLSQENLAVTYFY